MIQGHSGCKISVCNGILKKSSGTEYPTKRLKAQIQKQDAISRLGIHPNIVIPNIISEQSGEVYSAYMEYFPCSNIIQYLHKASKESLDSLVDNLINFVEYGILNSNLQTINKDIIVSKFESVDNSYEFRYKLEEFLQEDIAIPVGFCHGDLTLSNVLFVPDSNKIVLIDFLDSFIESPIIDIAKLRQDTKHGWSSFIHEERHDKIKTQLSLDYLDRKFVEAFSKYDFFKHYKLFQLMNLIRILPYAKQEKTLTFIREEICSL